MLRPRVPAFRVQLAVAALVVAVFILWVRNAWGGPDATVTFVNLASIAVPAAAGFACLYRAASGPAELRVAWRLMAAATLAWALGQVAWTVSEFRNGEPPSSPSLADVGYLLLIPLAALALAAMARRDGTRIDLRPVLDGSIVGASFIFIAFAMGLEPILLASSMAEGGLIVNLLYPFGDALLLGIVALRLSRAPAKSRGVVGFMSTGFALLAVADLWFLVVNAEGTYATGGILDAFWVAGFACIALAALRPDILQRTVEAAPSTKALALLPLYPFLLASIVSGYADLRDGYLSDTLFWTALVVVMLVLSRLVVMLFDNFALTRRLTDERALRTQMLNNVTHDLLSPLSTVRIQLRLLRGETLGQRTPAQDHALDVLERNIGRVGRLGGDLKDMANLEGEGLAMLLAPFDLAHEARRAVAGFEAEAATRGVALRCDAPAEAPVRGDAERIGQVLDNLLSNALKFTPRGGEVSLRLSAVPGSRFVDVDVTDSGRGLTDDERSRLFRPFSQVHRPGEIPERGTGLGLFISHGIAQQHEGELSVASNGHGHGASFRLRLPVVGPKATHQGDKRSTTPAAAGDAATEAGSDA